MRSKERESWMELLDAERELRREEQKEFMVTIKSLADRIQHPESRQIEVDHNYVPPEIPQDFAELAHIGSEVPDFVSVGSSDQLRAEEKEIAKIGTVEE